MTTASFAHTNDLPVEQQMPPEMVGKSILEKHGKSDANEAVLHELRARHALLHQENYHHSYPHCWRSKTPVIFRAMDQWFIEIDHVVSEGRRCTSPKSKSEIAELAPPTDTFRAAALAEIDRVKWIPDWGVNRIKSAVQTRPDWCISRQRTWGVPIPAFYDAKGEPILDAQIVRNAADLIEKHGSNVWFEKSAAELWSLVKPKDWKGAEAVAKSNDTLDVWIDSGCLALRSDAARGIASCGRLPPGPDIARSRRQRCPTGWQADVYLEGSDQHRGWFQSSLLLSLAGNGAAPFKTVLTHGFMVDADREKISKSKQAQGGYEKPQTAEAYVKKYGADIVRLWVASQDFRNDIVVSEERINKVGETYRVIRNALRYQLSNLYDFDPAKHTVRRRQAHRPRPLDSRRIFQAGAGSHRGLRRLRIPRRLSKSQPVHRRGAFLDLPRRHQRPALHRPGEFASPPLDPDRAAPAGDRPVPDARADSGVHGGRSVGICAGQTDGVGS